MSSGESMFNEILQFAQIGESLYAREKNGQLYLVHTYFDITGTYHAALYIAHNDSAMAMTDVAQGSTAHESVINVWRRRFGHA